MLVSSFCLFDFFFFKQKTAYEMRISDWSSDVCSSDLADMNGGGGEPAVGLGMCAWRELRPVHAECAPFMVDQAARDRKRVVSGKSVSVRVDLGGRRIIKKKKKSL